jgi:ATP-dependent Clp protease adapter protein ClpS
MLLLPPPQVTGNATLYHVARDTLSFRVPHTLLMSAFHGTWQQHGFKVQLTLHKDGNCIAGVYSVMCVVGAIL